MSKSDTIEAIVNLNPTAKPEFLAEFSNDDLHQYLHRLAFLPHTADEEADTTGTIEIGDRAPQRDPSDPWMRFRAANHA